MRKRARGDVTIRCPGTGEIKINGQEIDYFEDKQCREQVSAHFIYCVNIWLKMLPKFTKIQTKRFN